MNEKLAIIFLVIILTVQLQIDAREWIFEYEDFTMDPLRRSNKTVEDSKAVLASQKNCTGDKLWIGGKCHKKPTIKSRNKS
jgi:hypothetical protein